MSFKMVCLFLLTFLMPVLGFAQTKCAKPSTTKQLVGVGPLAERAFADMNEEKLRRHASEARDEILPCLTDRLGPSDSAVFHRLMALEAFTNNNELRTVREFHAARKLFPGYILPEDLAGPDHPLRKLYVQAETLDDGTAEKVSPPEKGYLMLGGIRNAPRFSNIPVLVQVYAQGDRLLETRYFQPGEKLPDWGKLNPMGITAQDLGIDTVPLWKKPSTWWIATGIASTLAVGFYGAALYQKSQFNDSSTPDRDLKGLQDRSNAFGYTALASGGLALITAGLGIGMQVNFGGDASPTVEPATWIPTPNQLGGVVYEFR